MNIPKEFHVLMYADPSGGSHYPTAAYLTEREAEDAIDEDPFSYVKEVPFLCDIDAEIEATYEREMAKAHYEYTIAKVNAKSRKALSLAHDVYSMEVQDAADKRKRAYKKLDNK